MRDGEATRAVRRWSVRHRWLLGIGIVLVGAVLLDRLVDLNPAPVYTNAAGRHFAGFSPEGALQLPSPSDVSEVEKQLHVRAEAVLDGDRAAFLGVVDADRRAFAAQQRTVWANTRQLPLARLSYAYDGVLEPDEPLTTPSFLVRVTTTYEFEGYDSSPVQVDDGFTFVRQDGTWRLAGVGDADGQFDRNSLPVPWDDGGAVTTLGDGHFLVVVDRGRRADARRILALCHQGQRASQRLLGASTTRPTVVLATTHATGFQKFVGLDFAAVTYPLSGPDGVTPGWRVLVNPHDVGQVASSPIVLPHELTHLATQDYLADVPSWLAEGSAEYVGWHGHGGLAAELEGRGFSSPLDLPDELPASPTFYRKEVQLHYVEGTALVAWLEEHKGRDAVLSLMRAFEDKGGYDVSFDPDRATPAILADTLGITPQALADAAYAEMNATLRSP
jgi:hypothetical protein